jgi:hypothetical protein
VKKKMSEANSVSSKILVYDLPSESLKDLDKESKDKVRTARVTSTKLLHSLGVQATESVILVAPSKVSKIEQIVQKVNELYSSLRLELHPNIVVLPLFAEQQVSLSTLARARVEEKIDEAINRINILLNNISTITQSSTRRRIRANLQETRKQFITLKQFCDELGIQNLDFDYLISLIDQATSKLQ